MEDKELNERYAEYVKRMKARIAKGEKITVQAKNKWIRVVEVEDTEHPGKTKEVKLPGVSGETKAERGSRVAEVRMGYYLDTADRLIQAAGAGYRYTNEQIDEIIAVVNDKTVEIVEAFNKKKDQKPEEKAVGDKKKKFQFGARKPAAPEEEKDEQ